MKMYSPSMNAFYVRGVSRSIPDDAVDVLNTEQFDAQIPDGMCVMPGEDNQPVICQEPPAILTREKTDVVRRKAYSNPITGSDPLFSEAYRMQLMGEEDWELVRDKAIARHEEIKAENPWPTK